MVEPLDRRLLPGRRAFAGALALLVLLAVPGAKAASANDVRTDSPSLLIQVGESATVGYSIGPGAEGCNPSPAAPVALTFVIPESFGVFPASLTFTACGLTQYVTYTSSVVGQFAITVRTSDGSGTLYQTVHATSTVLVHAPGDAVPPVIEMPPDVVVEATSPAGAEVLYVVAATDASDQVDHIACTPSGTLFPLGTTLVTCTAVDGRGNTDTGVFNVTVVDTTPPRLVVPRDVTFVSPKPPTLAYSPLVARDVVDGDFLPTCDPPSGSTFYSGTTLVTCTATDRAGNSATRTFSVVVVDQAPPALQLADVAVPAEGPDGAHVAYVATATDALDAQPTLVCVPPPGSLFPIGATLVTCTATDGAGNAATGTFTVRVLDAAPTLEVPTLAPFEATGPDGAAVAFDVAASDPEDGPLAPACAPASGSTFPLGTTLVTCTAQDAGGSVATGSFEVRVVDTTPPALALPADLTVDATGPTTPVLYAAGAMDLVSGEVAPACSPASGASLPVGPTLVTCTATDHAGNLASSTFTVRVVDRAPPVITAPTLVEASGSGPTAVSFDASALDAVDGAVAVACSPASGSAFPVGSTTVTCVATDAAGNAATHVLLVSVTDPAAPPPGGGGACSGDLGDDDRHDGRHDKDRTGLGLGHEGVCCEDDRHSHTQGAGHDGLPGDGRGLGVGHCCPPGHEGCRGQDGRDPAGDSRKSSTGAVAAPEDKATRGPSKGR